MMKKATWFFVTVLCLALCLSVFASCGKKDENNATTTTAETTTGGQSVCEHVWNTEYTVDTEATCTKEGAKSIYCSKCAERKPDSTVTIEKKQHTPDDKYTVDVPATCSSTGSESLYCSVCRELIEGSTRTIDIVPDAHKVDAWTVDREVSIFNAVGQRHGECTLCHKTITEALEYSLTVFNSKSTDNQSNDDPNYGNGSLYVTANAETARGDKHYYPTDEDSEGNDLWFEYSLLWNPTLSNYDGKLWNPVKRKFEDEQQSVIALISFRKKNGDRGTFKDLYRLYAQNDASVDCPYAGGLNFSTFRPLQTPATACIYEPDNLQTLYKGSLDDPVTASSFPTIGEYGWHRIGFRFHQWVEIDDEHPYPKVKAGSSATTMYGYSELYVDGVLIWKIEASMQGNWGVADDAEAGEWLERDHSLRCNGLNLYHAEIDAEDPTKINYRDNANLLVEMKLQDFYASDEAAYVAVDDVHLTCGKGFVHNVVPVENPEAASVTLDEGVVVSGAIYFRYDD